MNQRPSEPKLITFGVTQPVRVGDAGTISGISADMEYSTDDGVTWTAGSGEDVTAAGRTEMLIRYKANDTNFASEKCTILIMAIKTDDTCPIIIHNLDEFMRFSEAVKTGEADGNYYRLDVDIDLSTVCGAEAGSWTPIGNEPDAYYFNDNRSTAFNGTLDGNGHTVEGLYKEDRTIDSNSKDCYAGLFGYIGQAGTVKNLTVSGTVGGCDYVGTICGYNEGRVTGCQSRRGGFGSRFCRRHSRL